MALRKEKRWTRGLEDSDQQKDLLDARIRCGTCETLRLTSMVMRPMLEFLAGPGPWADSILELLDQMFMELSASTERRGSCVQCCFHLGSQGMGSLRASWGRVNVRYMHQAPTMCSG